MRLDAVHDLVFSQANKTVLKQVVIRLSIAGFAFHLLLNFLARWLPHPPTVIGLAGRNYLTAISTPFNFILFYEVLTLIGALHASTTRSIGYQFEIVSLVFIRDVFSDIAGAGDLVAGHRFTREALPLFTDMWAGFLMYLLVAVFQHVAQRTPRSNAATGLSPVVLRFIVQKKAVALGLTVLLLVESPITCASSSWPIYRAVLTWQATIEPATTFYNDLFTVMIFTDVLILILSLVVTGQYENVFRNAGSALLPVPL
jgi:hypothetical protein